MGGVGRADFDELRRVQAEIDRMRALGVLEVWREHDRYERLLRRERADGLEANNLGMRHAL